jgi:hypothetical protein
MQPLGHEFATRPTERESDSRQQIVSVVCPYR